jgi:hypothetical protein
MEGWWGSSRSRSNLWEGRGAGEGTLCVDSVDNVGHVDNSEATESWPAIRRQSIAADWLDLQIQLGLGVAGGLVDQVQQHPAQVTLVTALARLRRRRSASDVRVGDCRASSRPLTAPRLPQLPMSSLLGSYSTLTNHSLAGPQRLVSNRGTDTLAQHTRRRPQPQPKRPNHSAAVSPAKLAACGMLLPGMSPSMTRPVVAADRASTWRCDSPTPASKTSSQINGACPRRPDQ